MMPGKAVLLSLIVNQETFSKHIGMDHRVLNKRIENLCGSVMYPETFWGYCFQQGHSSDPSPHPPFF